DEARDVSISVRAFDGARTAKHEGFATSNLMRASLLLLLVLYCTGGSQAIYQAINSEESTITCTVFHHMVKSAGSTIKRILNQHAKEHGLPRLAMCAFPMREKYTPGCLSGLHHSAVIIGHGELIRKPLEKVGRRCEYFTAMRHPIDRLVSAFFYCPNDHDLQNRPSKWCGDSSTPELAAERLLDFAQQEWRNQAFRQMSFGMYCPPSVFCKESQVGPFNSLNEPGSLLLLQKVQDILSTYTAVGIMEHWELSMELFNARVKSFVKDWGTATEDVGVVNRGVVSG
ncbi:unnamed protein product, partial [Scytosiphon promiscuus]